jgi:hypothetical protein
MDFNKLNKEIGALRKAKQDASELQEKSKEIKVRRSAGRCAAAGTPGLLPKPVACLA